MDYLDAYTLTGDRLAGLSVPATLITAKDDPVVPIVDFETLALPDHATLLITDHGGHCGFIEDWQFNGYVEQLAAQQLPVWFSETEQ